MFNFLLTIYLQIIENRFINIRGMYLNHTKNACFIDTDCICIILLNASNIFLTDLKTDKL